MNNYSLNTKPINGTVLIGDYLLDNISFDNYGLQNQNIITEGDGLGIRDYPDRRISLTDIPQGDGQILNDTFFGGRTIRMSGVLFNENNLDELIDTFKLKLSFPNKKLKWRVGGEMREINATCTDITFGTKERIYIPFTATFESQDAFWRKIKQSSYLIENTSDNVRTEDIKNEFKKAYPLFILGIKSGTIDGITIKSNDVGITINNTISNGDILYIDGRNQEVLLNNIDIDYDGVFPRFENGSNNVEFDITGTYTADINIIWRNNLV